MTTPAPPRIVVMGVQGSGKSTIAALLAERLGVAYLDADDLHSADAVARMAAGHPLGDAERSPWLAAVGRHLSAASDGIVIACSALKRRYRDQLRDHAPDLVLVYLAGNPEQIAARVSARRHAFMPASLLDSQLRDLQEPEPDEHACRVDIAEPPSFIVDRVLRELDRGMIPGSTRRDGPARTQ